MIDNVFYIHCKDTKSCFKIKKIAADYRRLLPIIARDEKTVLAVSQDGYNCR